MEVVELKNPRALGVAEVANLFKRAFEKVKFAAPGGFDSVARDIFEFVTNDNYFVFLGAEKGQFKALAMGFYPSNNIFPYPTITLIYNEGSKELKDLLVRKMVDTMVSMGYTACWAINASGHSDKVWLKAVVPNYGDAEFLGSVYEFKIK
jgi:hypothetical protein